MKKFFYHKILVKGNKTLFKNKKFGCVIQKRRKKTRITPTLCNTENASFFA